MPDLQVWCWVSLYLSINGVVAIVSIVVDRDSFYGSTQPTYRQMSTHPSTPSDNFCNLYIGMVSLDSNLLVLIHLPLKEWSIRCLLTNIK